MARVAKSKAEDLEAVQTAQEAAQDAPGAEGDKDTAQDAEAVQNAPQEAEPEKLVYVGPQLPRGRLKTNKIFEGTRLGIRCRYNADHTFAVFHFVFAFQQLQQNIWNPLYFVFLFRQAVLVDFRWALFSVRARFRFHFKDNAFCVFLHKCGQCFHKENFCHGLPSIAVQKPFNFVHNTFVNGLLGFFL